MKLVFVLLVALTFDALAAATNYALSDSQQMYVEGSKWSGKAPSVQGLIFSENFDTQPDWMNDGKKSAPYIPAGWDSLRVDEEWHPSVEVGTQPAMQITGSDPDKVYGGSGKALVMYAESFNATDDNGWSSDAILTKDFPEGHDEIYVKLNIKFQDGFGDGLINNNFGSSKIFRVAHWDGVGSRYDFGTDGQTNPMYIWNWYSNNYGVRHQHAYRCDPQGTNYYCTVPTITDTPRQMLSGDISMNFVSDVAYLSPQIPDLLNGGFVSSDSDGIVEQRQIWGNVWHTLEWYVKINSGPGIQDGVMSFWLDGQKIMHMETIPWIGTNGEAGNNWNLVSIGGNDHHHTDLSGNPVDREYWYSLDNIEIHNSLPEERQ